MAVSVTIELTGLEGVMNTLRALPPEIASKRGGPVRAALRKGALVIHKQALSNLKRVTSNQTDDDARQNTQMLEQNLVVTRGKAPFNDNGERYLVRVRRKVYKRSGKENVTTLKTAQLLEYGSSQQPAEPWLRPAFSARAPEAIKVIETELIRAVDRAIRKASRGKGKLE